MKRRFYYPASMGAMLPFLQNLCATAPNYIVQLKITGPELSFLNLMCALWEALVDFQNRAKNFAKDWTTVRMACFDGPAGATPPAWPLWTGPATPPVGLTTGCGQQLRAMIARWKKEPGYTDDIGTILGIVGAEINVDPETAQPDLRVEIVAGRPVISAGLQGFDAVEVEVDRGSGFSLFNACTGAPITDSHPLPAPGESDVWTYRGVLRDGDKRVGQWSLSVPVAVVGI